VGEKLGAPTVKKRARKRTGDSRGSRKKENWTSEQKERFTVKEAVENGTCRVGGAPGGTGNKTQTSSSKLLEK